MFTVPLEVSWSEQFTISNENVWRLLLQLHIGAALPQMRHEHVSARYLQRIVVKQLLHRKCMEKLTTFIAPQHWLQLKRFLFHCLWHLTGFMMI